jgi:hypothetical protein
VSKKYVRENSNKVTFYLENNTNEILNAVIFLTGKKKVHLLNEATQFFLNKIIEEEDLKEKIDVMLK